MVGAGDSYAAALIASNMSSGKIVAADPYAVFVSPDFAIGRDVFFISVSGWTVSNLAAARRLRGTARRVAVTSSRSSPLASEADEVVLLPYDTRPRSVGTLSFTLSLLAVMKAVLGEVECDFEAAFARGRALSRKFLLAGNGTTFFLGNLSAHGVALYAAAKVYEMLGSKSHAEHLEQFSHMELFSMRRSDTVNILGINDPSKLGAKLKGALSERGYGASLIFTEFRGIYDQIFSSIFAAQLAILSMGKRRGMKEPYFVGARDKLGVSDALIY